jgi:hypothetical protein
MNDYIILIIQVEENDVHLEILSSLGVKELYTIIIQCQNITFVLALQLAW